MRAVREGSRAQPLIAVHRAPRETGPSTPAIGAGPMRRQLGERRVLGHLPDDVAFGRVVDMPADRAFHPRVGSMLPASPKRSNVVMRDAYSPLAHPRDQLGETVAAVLEVFGRGQRDLGQVDDLDRGEDQRVHAVEVADPPDVARERRFDPAVAEPARHDRHWPVRQRRVDRRVVLGREREAA